MVSIDRLASAEIDTFVQWTLFMSSGVMACVCTAYSHPIWVDVQ